MNGASAVICWGDKILFFHRDDIPSIPDPDCWQLPGGGIEKGETSLVAVKRELGEEVTYCPDGLEFLASIKREDGRTSYLFGCFVDDDKSKLFKLGKDEGQEIRFFTIEEALGLKLTPAIKYYLNKYRSEIEKALETKSFQDLKQVFEQKI